MPSDLTSWRDRSCLFRRAALLGLGFTLAAGMLASAGDILRGGSPAGSRSVNARPSANLDPATEQARANAKDALSRTTQAIQSVRTMQEAARQAARTVNNLGMDPNRPNVRLPNVPDGLVKGGLQVDPRVPKDLASPGPAEDSSLWQGARLPVEIKQKNRTIVTIDQTKRQAVLTWETFNIGRDTTLNFNQSRGGTEKGTWIAFNKVNDPSGSPTQILGAINAPGQVYIINRNGIIFGGTSEINLHTLVASSLPINDTLVRNGLLNNPKSDFLFAAPKVTDPAFVLPADQTSYTLTQAEVPGSALAVLAGSTSLVLKTDYTLSRNSAGKAVLTFTEAGLAKIGTAKVTVTYFAPAGDVTVQSGARLSSPTDAEHVGGRIALVGPNVTNSGTIDTPDGQTILAAGLQVGFAAHAASDPSLRGLDVFVGAEGARTGTAKNDGLISVPRASAILAGKAVDQLGAIDGSTSATLNGRIDLLANYDAVSNPNYDATKTATNGAPMLPRASGTVTLGPDSVTRILPELENEEKVVGTQLSLPSLVNLQGQAIHFASHATLLAPGATLPSGPDAITPLSGLPVFDLGDFRLSAGVTINAGTWDYRLEDSGPASRFVYAGGQIYLDPGAIINVAGTGDVSVPVAQNILSLQLRGAELADAPLQRTGLLRGPMLNIDLRQNGLFNGEAWIGTPLGNVAAYVGLIERSVGELTTAGGSVSLRSGGSVIMQTGSKIDVSGGWIDFQGGLVQTTRVLSGGQILDIAQATPDRVYDGIYDGTFTTGSAKWGVTQTFQNALAPTGAHYEPDYVQGANGGSIAISAPSTALDGTLLGKTIAGPRQQTNAPAPGALALEFKAQDQAGGTRLWYSPTPPTVTFRNTGSLAPAGAFETDANGTPAALRADRIADVTLDPNLFRENGFGTLYLNNGDGNVFVPAETELQLPAGGSLTIQAANLDIQGKISAPAGKLDFTAYNHTPEILHALEETPAPTAGRGQFRLGAAAALSTEGSIVDERLTPSAQRLLPGAVNSATVVADPTDASRRITITTSLTPISSADGGTISIKSYDADFQPGSSIDVSGGLVLGATGQRNYGKGGSIIIQAGNDPKIPSLLGGELRLASTLRGFSGATGGSLSILAPLIQVGGSAAPEGALYLTPEFFQQGGFTSYTLNGLGAQGEQTGEYLPGFFIAPGTVIEPTAENFVAEINPSGESDLSLRPELFPAGLRTPVSLTLGAPGVKDDYHAGAPVIRGDFVMGEGAVISTEPLATVTISGQTATVLGSIIAPGGTISISGEKNPLAALFTPLPAQALPTVYLGPHSLLSTAGVVVLKPDPRGYRIGDVLPGGTISIAGNLVADPGSVLDVSGSSGVLDLPPIYSGLGAQLLGALSGLTAATNTAGNGLQFRGLLQPLPPGGVPDGTVYGSFTGAPVVATRVESNAGSITLQGGQLLYSEATLLGAAGGPSALGGSLTISSGRYNAAGVDQTPLDPTLVVVQNPDALQNPFHATGQPVVGHPLVDQSGRKLPGNGFFAVNTFLQGGFDSLELKGTVDFRGTVTIDARGSITVARKTSDDAVDGGVILADAPVTLRAPYVALGQLFQGPLNDAQQQVLKPYQSAGKAFLFPPTFGPGRLTVVADLIDLGNLSLQNIGRADLLARGDIRGNGTFDLAGDLVLQAGQIYPTTAGTFTLAVYDRNVLVAKSGVGSTEVQLVSDVLPPGFGVGSPLLGSTVQSIAGKTVTLASGANVSISASTSTTFAPGSGSITILGNGASQLPLSAAGTLNLFASRIDQGGVLRAPLGTINLGWDGTGTGPKDSITGQAVAIAQSITLRPESWTSVSAIDPATGLGVTIPYGLNLFDTTWVDPRGLDITAGAAPGKSIHISGLQVGDLAGSTIDLRGGGDLYAWRWIPGNGGSKDILASASSFAVIPGYEADFAPYAPNNSTTSAANLAASDPGYVNSSLKVGDRIYLGASNGLPAGVYTLLPARYALLNGAFLVTPQTASPVGSFALADGSNIVSGYRFNDLNATRSGTLAFKRFEVASGEVVRARSQYADYFASSYLRMRAADLGISIPRLPNDSGRLVLSGANSLVLQGAVLGEAAFEGRRALIDISSLADITVTGGRGGGGPGVVLDASLLNSYGAESLLIGGIRQFGTAGTTISVQTSHLTIAGGALLTGPELLLAAGQELKVEAGAQVVATGSIPGGRLYPTIPLLIGDAAVPGSGDGAFLRVSGVDAPLLRSGVGTSQLPTLSIGAGALVSSNYLSLDSTGSTLLDPNAQVIGNYLSLSSGRISLLLSDPGTLQADPGLILSGTALRSLQSAASLTLTSYSSFDLYGTGTFRVGGLTLHTAEIRGFNQGTGTATISSGSLTLDNLAGTTSSGPVDGLLPTGKLIFDAGTIQLGRNQLQVDQYADLELRASGRLLVRDSGGLSTRGNLTVTTPLITGAKLANQSIVAAGDLILKAPSGSASPTTVGGLAASLTLAGATVTQNSHIVLPSGTLTLHATGSGGDISVGGSIDVSGTAQQIYDLIGYTDGGTINLVSDQGSVNLRDGSTISVAAKAGGGNAGTLAISAIHGGVNLAGGSLHGFGGAGGTAGNFRLDAGTIPAGGVSSIDLALNEGGFTQSRNYRVRTGDVSISGVALAHDYTLSADQGSIDVTDHIDASGAEGGAIRLVAGGSVVLEDGTVLSVEADDFDSAGKGSAVSLEAGSAIDGNFSNVAPGTGPQLSIKAGSTINLGVRSTYGADGLPDPAKVLAAAALGQFTGTLHLRAPQAAGNTDLQIQPIDGTVIGGSRLVVEGYQLYVPVGGAIDSVKGAVLSNGTTFGSGTAAMTNRLFANNAGLIPLASIQPGAEIINASTGAPLPIRLNNAGSSGISVTAGVPITFAAGTPGATQVRFSVAGTVTADGVTTAFAAATPMTLAPGSVVNLSASGNVIYASGAGGPVALSLPSGSNYTSVGATTVQSAGSGNTLQLNTASSAITLTAGGTITFPSGSGANQVRFASAGSVTSPDGVTTAFAANSVRTLLPGSVVKLNGAGAVTYVSGTSGAIPIAVSGGAQFTTSAGTSTVATPNGDLTLFSNWDLSTYRFGPNQAPGILTLRAAGNLVFNVANPGTANQAAASLSDGFGGTSTYGLWDMNLLAAGTQSWSYRLAAGADLSAADYRQVQSLAALGANGGSFLLGKGSPALPTATAANRNTVIPRFFQTIRTGTGDIDIIAGRDVQILNPLATIYTAGAQAPAMAEFDTPLSFIGQLPFYSPQYSLGGGNVTISAQNDIGHYLATATGLTTDSSKELPNNWLYRRDWVNPATGLFGQPISGNIASTSWWIDFSNFFQGVGALGGGNVTLTAGRDVINLDAVTPTNARMPGYTDASKTVVAAPDLAKLLELGGGDVSVTAGRDLSGGLYYVERGEGTLHAGRDITTNANRAATLPGQVSLSVNPTTWLPTTLFLGKGDWNLFAGGNLLLGPVVNPFLLPQGVNNSFLYKTYFTTYRAGNAVNATALTGDLTIRTSANSSDGSLYNWLQYVQFQTGSLGKTSQPWLSIIEDRINDFAMVTALFPGTLKASASSGDINLVGTLTLTPSPTGTIELAAAGAINGLSPNAIDNGVRVWSSSSINLSDSSPNDLPGPATPFSPLILSPSTSNTDMSGMDHLNLSLRESGSVLGQFGVIQTQQALHGTSLLHADDPNPIRIYAGDGDISGLTLYAGKAAQVYAGNDITDVSLYLQNTKEGDVSIISAGRDITLYAPNSALRQEAQTAGNKLRTFTSNGPASGSPTAGDLQIGGPGAVEILAGRNLDLGAGPNNIDGTGVGIVSIGNSRNPNLPFGGADIIAAAGIGGPASLGGNPSIDFATFRSQFLKTGNSGYLAELGLDESEIESLPVEAQNIVALRIFYLILRDAGRASTLAGSSSFGNYDAGFAAISQLFGTLDRTGAISTRSRDIRTRSGGNISLVAPGGGLTLQTQITGNTLAPPGIITEDGGNISIFTDGDVDIGISRIFTFRGGDITIWSSSGDIAAGNSPKTVQSAPPTRVIIEPQSADVKIDLSGLATGGGIGVLATVGGVPPGNVDLIAPIGTVDAGDAGIRATGNLNIAAVQVLNADNIQVGGTTSGVPSAPAVTAPNLGGLVTASSAAGAAAIAATEMAKEPRRPDEPVEVPSIITVEVMEDDPRDSVSAPPLSETTDPNAN